MLKAILL